MQPLPRRKSGYPKSRTFHNAKQLESWINWKMQAQKQIQTKNYVKRHFDLLQYFDSRAV